MYGTLANNSKVVLSESITAPIVVRGRSPRNFQARKEIPLLGSSAGSRGQALVESGMGVVAGPLNVKQQEAKARGVDVSLPRTAFTFSPQKASASQLNSIRSKSVSTLVHLCKAWLCSNLGRHNQSHFRPNCTDLSP